MFLLIDNYDSFTYNLYALFRSCGAELDIVKNDEFREADAYDGIILSPGPSSPEHSGTSLRYLSMYLGSKPMFGVCLGMQAMAFSLGYGIVPAASIMHGKVDRISVLRDSVLLKDVPETFSAVRYHSLAVEIDERYVTSRSEKDGVIMSIEDSQKKFFGVQFHPESILSEYGERIVGNFMNFVNGGI